MEHKILICFVEPAALNRKNRLVRACGTGKTVLIWALKPAALTQKIMAKNSNQRFFLQLMYLTKKQPVLVTMLNQRFC